MSVTNITEETDISSPPEINRVGVADKEFPVKKRQKNNNLEKTKEKEKENHIL